MKSIRESRKNLGRIVKRLIGRITRRQSAPAQCKQDDIMFRRMEEVICSSKLFCRKSLSLELLAGELHTNRNYVSGLLHRRGYSFSAYINGFRVQYAILLLCCSTDDDMSAEAIADACGFMSVRTLNYYLRKTFGLSFSILRKRVRTVALDNQA